MGVAGDTQLPKPSRLEEKSPNIWAQFMRPCLDGCFQNLHLNCWRHADTRIRSWGAIWELENGKVVFTKAPEEQRVGRRLCTMAAATESTPPRRREVPRQAVAMVATPRSQTDRTSSVPRHLLQESCFSSICPRFSPSLHSSRICSCVPNTGLN